MRKPKTKFVIFCNQMIGEIKPARSISELLELMTKRHKQFWSNIMWRDEQGRSMTFTREFLEQGMSIPEVIEDWELHGTHDDLIIALDPKGSGTIHL